MFVDKALITLQAGDGGNGAVSFRHEKFVDRGGPDGGDGGNGGSIILMASRNQNTLATFRYQKLLKAGSGGDGTKRKKHGKSGQDLIVKVPVGTVVATIEGEIIADLTQDAHQEIVVKGGLGGFGNAHFTSSVRQAPRVAEKGEKGECKEVVLELKMIADVGLIGLPNAGKSTLLSIVSSAQPTIANYPFTTITPNLGVVDINDDQSLLFADIPGLIEGASQGKGLGDEFLRHVERTSVLIHLIDSYQNDVAKAYKVIQKELGDYTVDLTKRPQVVVLSKIDGLDKDITAAQIEELKLVVPSKTKIMSISAKSGDGVKNLLTEADKLVKKYKIKQSQVIKNRAKNQLPVLRLSGVTDKSWQVTSQKNFFIVTGKKVERFALKTDFTNPHGTQRLRDIMRKMGIMHELEKQSIEAGQTIKVGVPTIGELTY